MNCVCPDLCGGCPAMAIPTAIPSDKRARMRQRFSRAWRRSTPPAARIAAWATGAPSRRCSGHAPAVVVTLQVMAAMAIAAAIANGHRHGHRHGHDTAHAARASQTGRLKLTFLNAHAATTGAAVQSNEVPD